MLAVVHSALYCSTSVKPPSPEGVGGGDGLVGANTTGPNINPPPWVEPPLTIAACCAASELMLTLYIFTSTGCILVIAACASASLQLAKKPSPPIPAIWSTKVGQLSYSGTNCAAHCGEQLGGKLEQPPEGAADARYRLLLLRLQQVSSRRSAWS